MSPPFSINNKNLYKKIICVCYKFSLVGQSIGYSQIVKNSAFQGINLFECKTVRGGGLRGLRTYDNINGKGDISKNTKI